MVRSKIMARNQKPFPVIPAWAKAEPDDCLVSIGEEVYTARNLAVAGWNADQYSPCTRLLTAGDKNRQILDDMTASVRARVNAGERALGQYQEAKLCARRTQTSTS